MRIAFVITGLETGGAEMMLLKVLSRLHRDRYEPYVVSLRGGGDLAERFKAMRVPLYSLGMAAGRILPLIDLFRLVGVMRSVRPDVVQGWMYHGNIAAQCVAAFLRGHVPVLWNVRAGGSIVQGKWQTRMVIWLGGRLSHLPLKIINNSITSAAAHEQRFGYRVDKRLVIPNGFDTDVFVPSDEARSLLRKELDVPESALLIGLIGRYTVEKNHIGFLHAAAELRASRPDVVFVLAGAGADQANAELAECVARLQLGPAVRLLGKRTDMPKVTAALDISVCCSHSEGFPNVVGEAMSCGVPCVVTDVGDCAYVVGDTGRVVAPGDKAALVQGMRELLDCGPEAREVLGRRARQRVVEKFSLDAVVAMYEELYRSISERQEQQCAA